MSDSDFLLTSQDAQTKKIKFKTNFTNVIAEACKQRGWEQVESEDETQWDFYWNTKKWLKDEFPKITLAPHQRIVHFPNHGQLTRKDNLCMNVKQARKALMATDPNAYHSFDFFPMTYLLPDEWAEFEEDYHKSNCLWIIKPVCRARGVGISLVTNLEQALPWSTPELSFAQLSPEEQEQNKDGVSHRVIQKYIANPYLIDGRKFDMRIYVLVTSYSPLRVYIYRSGIGRFSCTKYVLDESSYENLFVHLTNNAIQKLSSEYSSENDCKETLQYVRQRIVESHGEECAAKVFLDIQNLIIKSLLCVQSAVTHCHHCFELYGFDVLIDDQMKSYLLEVNGSPSMTPSSVADHDLKLELVTEILDITNIEKRPESEIKLRGFDLVYANETYQLPDKSYLGLEHAQVAKEQL